MSALPPVCESFSIIDGHRMAIAEVSIWIDPETMTEFNLPADRPWYFFNRINTPPTIRRRGHATELMKRLVKWADDGGYAIFCPINPYGDLNLQQLTAFYTKFGFKELEPGLVVRYKGNGLI